MIRRAVLAGLVMALLAGSPAAALDAEYDGFYGLVASTYGRGITLVEVLVANKARVSAGLLGLQSSSEYRLAFSKAPCGRPGTAGKEVLALHFTTDATGGAYFAEVVPWLWVASAPVPLSARLTPTAGGPRLCVKAAAFSRMSHTTGGTALAEMAYARFWDGGRRGLVVLDRLDGDSGRLTWSFTGLAPGTYRLTGATVACAQRVNAANRLYSVTFGPDIHGNAAGNQDIEVENDETHWVGSDRLKRVGGGQWGCRNAAVTDLVIDQLRSKRRGIAFGATLEGDVDALV